MTPKTFANERPGARWEHRRTGEVWVVTQAHRPLDMQLVTHLTLRREGGDEVMVRWRVDAVTRPHPAIIRRYQRLREVTGSLRTVGTLTAEAHLAWLDPEGVLSEALRKADERAAQTEGER